MKIFLYHITKAYNVCIIVTFANGYKIMLFLSNIIVDTLLGFADTSGSVFAYKVIKLS